MKVSKLKREKIKIIEEIIELSKKQEQLLESMLDDDSLQLYRTTVLREYYEEELAKLKAKNKKAIKWH
ncbi:MAG: hypothetical protein QW719_01925 [Candidatus Micrarchaeaceae archaeon]